MATVIEELVSRLGFDINDKGLNDFTKSSERLKKTLKRISVVASAAAVGITAWVSKVAIATDANIKFADSVGISFDALQELQFATEREGGSLQSLQSSLLALSQRAGEAFRGMGEGVQVFGILGVEVTDFNGDLKSADVLLGDISDQFKNFGKTQQIEFAQKLGISPDLLLLMQKGSENLNDLRLKARSFGLISEQTARNSEKFQDSLTDLKFTIRAVFTNIAGDLLPVVVDLADKLRDLFQKNKDIIKQKIAKSVKFITSAIKLLTKNAKLLLKIASSIIALKVMAFAGSMVIGMHSVVTSLIGLNTSLAATDGIMSAMSIKVGLIIAVFIALALVWDDLNEARKGKKKTLFGDMADDSETARKALDILFTILDSIKTIIEAIIAAPFRLIKIILDLIEIVKFLGMAIKNTIGNTIDSISDRIDGIISKFKIIRDFFKGPDMDIKFGPNGQMFVPGPADPSDLSSNITTITAPITIQSASGNPIEIGRAVETALGNMVRNGINNNPLIVVA